MSKQTVILLHSGGMSSRQWKKLNEALSATHQVIAPDMIGSGDNPPWPDDEPFDWHQDLAIIEKLVASVGEPVHLVGHSYGGLVATTLARLHPEQVRSLTAYDPVSFGVLYGKDDAAAEDLHRLQHGDTKRGGDEAWLEAFIDWWNKPGSWKAMPPPAQDAFRKTARKVFWEAHSLSKDRTPIEAYDSVTAPSLFITGELTPHTAQRVVEIFAKGLPNARYEKIAGAGHMGPITHAAQVNPIIVKHITGA